MNISVNTRDNDYMSTVSLLEKVRPMGIVSRMSQWLEELREEFRNQRIEFDPIIDFPRDI